MTVTYLFWCAVRRSTQTLLACHHWNCHALLHASFSESQIAHLNSTWWCIWRPFRSHFAHSGRPFCATITLEFGHDPCCFGGVFLCSPVFLCFLFFVQPLFVLNNIVRLPLFDKLFDPFSLELTFDHCRPSSMSVTPSTCATNLKHRRMRSHSGP